LSKRVDMAAAHTRIRWDRLGRWALLFVLGLVLYLYIGPLRTWVSTWQEAKQKRQEVATLRAQNQQLRAHEDSLQRSSALEREARRLGMVKAGERAYIVEGLPKPAR
jgi:cell division protein FtsB